MKRLEEINIKANSLYNNTRLGTWENIRYYDGARDGFIDGARWADENPSTELINKVVNLIVENKPNKDMSDFEMYQFCEFIRSKLYKKD